MKAHLQVNIKPVPKARPRLGRYGKAYTPKSTLNYENAIMGEYIANNLPNFGDKSITVEIEFGFIPPASWSNKKKMLALKGECIPSKGDLDNYVKAVLDALNGIAYKDDRYIRKFICSKSYKENDLVDIKIYD